MPPFYFHLFNDFTNHDDEGTELPNAAVAMEATARMAREMAAESVREGRLVLQHRIEVTDERGATVGAVHFRDVVEVRA